MSSEGNGALVSLSSDEWGRLVLVDGQGKRHVGVEPVRAFPLSAPRQGVSICDADGREIVWVDDLDGLPAELRQGLEERLARREFVPVVRRVLSVSTTV